MDPMTWLTVLAPAAALLIAAGIVGGLIAERVHTARLVGAVLAGMLLGPAVLGHLAPTVHQYLFAGGSHEQAQLDAKRREMNKALDAARDTGVSNVYLQDLRRRYETTLATLDRTLHESRTQREKMLGVAIGVPVLLVALFICINTLLSPPLRSHFGRTAVILLSAMLISGGAAAGVGAWGAHAGWLDLGGLAFDTYVIGLIVGCAMPNHVDAEADRIADANPLWRWLFEPLIFALAGSQFAFTAMHPVLIIVVLLLFLDAKALGAIAAARFMHRSSWTDALRIGTRVASGTAAALAAAFVLHAAGVIGDPLFTALVFANVIAAACVNPMLRMLQPATDEPRPTADTAG